jgi:hypothetical protein
MANMRAILKEVGLPLKFWDKSVEYDIYIRHCTNIGLDLNGINRSLTEVFIEILPDIEMCKTWGSKYYSYINPKTMSNRQCYDKLRDTGQVEVFLGYSNEITKYIKVYSLELGYTGHSSRVMIDETQKGGNLDLRLRNCIAELQANQNVVPDRKPRGRPKIEKFMDHIFSFDYYTYCSSSSRPIISNIITIYF